MIHYSRVISGLAAYIDTEIVGKMHGSLKAWALGSMAGVALSRADSMFRTLAAHPMAASLGLVDGENVNVDAIMAELRKQAQRGTATIDIPLMGPITFSIADVEALDRYIKGA